MFEKPLGLRENPFLAGHNPKYVFPSREHQEALAHLRYGIQNREPFVLITGEVGTGKTTAVYDAIAEWGSRARFALITNSALTRIELLEEICLRFGGTVPSPMSKPQALVELQRQLAAVRGRGELAILLVDEAQNLDQDLLEEIRLLSNLELNGEYLLQIFLVGQPELEHKLGQRELRQLRQRIGIHYRILPLSATETASYIHHRVSVAGGHAEELFPADTCVEIFRITNGIPREINIVAGQSLLNAFVEDGRVVTPEHVRGVEREIEFQSVLRHEAGRARAARASTSSAAPKKRPRPKPATPAPPGATIIPMPPPHSASESGAPPRRAAPPPEQVAAGAEAESDVEMTGPHYGRGADESEEALVEELPGNGENESAGESVEEFTPEEPRATPEELKLPPWIDEIVSRRRAMDELAARLNEPIEPQGAGTARHESEPPDRGFESDPGRSGHEDEPGPPSGTYSPGRSVPHTAEHLSLFQGQPAEPESLPPRLREKLAEEAEPDRPRRNSLAWPIASLIIAALAITVILFVRFGPWSGPRRASLPAGDAGSAAMRDSTPLAFDPFPPMEQGASSDRAAGERLGQESGSGVPAPAGGRESDTRTTSDGALAEPSESGPDAPSSDASSGTATATPAQTGDTRDEATRASIVPVARTYGIAVGTYINEARATAERTRLNEGTQLPTRLVTVSEGTVTMYRVVVGTFGDRGSAERAASEMVRLGLVTEARVIAVAQTAAEQP